jgi:hypothetical protein
VYNRSNVAARSFYKWKGVYVTTMYLFCKLLYIVNVVGQLFMLNAFLGPNYKMWGFGILADIIAGNEWETSGHFPRVCAQPAQIVSSWFAGDNVRLRRASSRQSTPVFGAMRATDKHVQ